MPLYPLILRPLGRISEIVLPIDNEAKCFALAIFGLPFPMPIGEVSSHWTPEQASEASGTN